MNYQNTTDQTIKTYRDLKKELHASLPPDGTELIMEVWHHISLSDKPGYDSHTEKVVEIAPVDYVQVWEIQDLEQTEIDDIIATAKVKKERDIKAYGEALITEANTDPIVGVTVDPADNVKRVNSRRNDRADKVSYNTTLTDDEKNEAKNDQKLAEFTSKIYADIDKAIENMLKLDTASAINTFNIPAQNWNVWVAPSF